MYLIRNDDTKFGNMAHPVNNLMSTAYNGTRIWTDTLLHSFTYSLNSLAMMAKVEIKSFFQHNSYGHFIAN